MKIDFVKLGEISINGKIYYSDVIAYWDGEIEMVTKDHIFHHNDLLKISQKNPEMIIIGTGLNQMVRITEEAQALAEEKGIELFIEESKKASEIFTAFVFEGKKAVAVIHTTC